MNIEELQLLVHKQQDQILTLQVLVQCLVDELVTTEVVSEDTLDERLHEKIKSLNSQLKEMRKEKYGDMPFNYSGPVGEA